ncbi:hypothetical protein X777_06508, partial [Ooceraea biroi]
RRRRRKRRKKNKTEKKKRRKTMEKRAGQRSKRETCVREERRRGGRGARGGPRELGSAQCNQRATSAPGRSSRSSLTRLSVSDSDLSIVSIPVPGPFSIGEQSSIGAGTKRMTLARVVRILVVLVLPLLLIVDGSWAQAYPREIKPGERSVVMGECF